MSLVDVFRISKNHRDPNISLKLNLAKIIPALKCFLRKPVSGLCWQMASLSFIAHFTTEVIGGTEQSCSQTVNLIVKTGCNK